MDKFDCLRAGSKDPAYVLIRPEARSRKPEALPEHLLQSHFIPDGYSGEAGQAGAL
jgi:hypothetical protein